MPNPGAGGGGGSGLGYDAGKGKASPTWSQEINLKLVREVTLLTVQLQVGKVWQDYRIGYREVHRAGSFRLDEAIKQSLPIFYGQCCKILLKNGQNHKNFVQIFISCFKQNFGAKNEKIFRNIFLHY